MKLNKIVICSKDLRYESIETITEYTHMMYENMKRICKSDHERENNFHVETIDEYFKEY